MVQNRFNGSKHNRNRKFRSKTGRVTRKDIKNLDKKIKKINNQIELKFLDTGLAPALISSNTPTLVYHLNNVTQGVGVNSRISDQVTGTSLQFRGEIKTNIDNVTSSTIRMLCFFDKQPQGAAPVVYGASSTPVILDTDTITNPLYSPYNYAYLERYEILMDKRIVITPETVGAFDTTTGVTEALTVKHHTVNFKRKFHKIIKWDGNLASTIADASRNTLWVAFIGDQTVASGLGPNISFGARFYYKDA